MISIIITLIVVGVLLWLVEAVIPMDATIKQIIRVVILVLVVLWLLSALLGYGGGGDIAVPRLR